MSRTIKNRISNLEDRNTKKRVVWVWKDDYKPPVKYTTRDGETITAAELAALEADPGVKVVLFEWVDELEVNRYEQ